MNIKKILMPLVVVGLFLSTTSVFGATAATVNGIKITVSEANKALKVLTKGKKTWTKLPKDAKEQLIQMLAPAKLVSVVAKKQLTKKEKEAALTGFWMQKKMSKIKISDKEAKSAYAKMQKAAKATKSKKELPTFQKAKNSIKMQIAQEKVVSKLMKKAKIKIK
jgi:hypothetical protein